VLIFDKEPSKNNYRKKQNDYEKVDSKNEADNDHHLLKINVYKTNSDIIGFPQCFANMSV